jgi:hypothetical protein
MYRPLLLEWLNKRANFTKPLEPPRSYRFVIFRLKGWDNRIGLALGDLHNRGH